MENQLLFKVDGELAEKIMNFIHRLNELDLQAVFQKLVSVSESYQCKEEVQYIISQYKMLLCLHFLFPDVELAPTQEIDRVWHTHILLNTAKYIEDCQRLYGYILHHYSPNDDLDMNHKCQQAAWERTKQLFLEIFGIEIYYNRVYHYGRCLILPQRLLQSHRSACLTIPKP